jgi:hypothetical protein
MLSLILTRFDIYASAPACSWTALLCYFLQLKPRVLLPHKSTWNSVTGEHTRPRELELTLRKACRLCRYASLPSRRAMCTGQAAGATRLLDLFTLSVQWQASGYASVPSTSSRGPCIGGAPFFSLPASRSALALSLWCKLPATTRYPTPINPSPRSFKQPRPCPTAQDSHAHHRAALDAAILLVVRTWHQPAFATHGVSCRYTSVHESTQQLPLTLRQCSAITFLTGGNNESSIQPTPPYTLFVYPSDDIPRVIAGGMDGSAARWRVDYPVGTQLLLAFADSKGNPGGTSALTTVINGQSNDCVSPSNTTLSLGYTPAAPSTCQSVSLLPSGGVPPYAVTIQKAGDQGINITEVSNTTSWTNDLQAGGSIICASE